MTAHTRQRHRGRVPAAGSQGTKSFALRLLGRLLGSFFTGAVALRLTLGQWPWTRPRARELSSERHENLLNRDAELQNMQVGRCRPWVASRSKLYSSAL